MKFSIQNIPGLDPSLFDYEVELEEENEEGLFPENKKKLYIAS